MISASHNPYQDNGIKLIGHSGYKLPDEQEEMLEAEIFALLGAGSALASRPCSRSTKNLDRTYIDHLAGTVPGGLQGSRSSPIAPTVRRRSGSRAV